MRRSLKLEQGVITVLVSSLLMGFLSLGTISLEAGRYQVAKDQLSEASISAATSMIAAYDTTLYERYGLLAIDTKAATVDRCRDYLEFNSDLSAGYSGNNVTQLYAIDTVEMEGLYNLTYPSVLKRQLLSRAKHHIIAQDYSLNYYNMDAFLADLQSKAQYVAGELSATASGSASAGSLDNISPEMQDALRSLNQVFKDVKKYDEACDVTLNEATTSILPSMTGTVENVVPAEDITAMNSAVSDAESILGSNGAMLGSDGNSTYSETDVSLNVSYISQLMTAVSVVENLPFEAKNMASNCRNIAQGITVAIDNLSDDKEGNLLLNSYIAGYFSSRNRTISGYMSPAKGTPVNGTMENATFSAACTEYVFAGDVGEKLNQEKAYDYIMAIRLINNLYTTIQSSNSYDSNNASSVAAHIAWAYFETCADTELLAKYNTIVPLVKYSMIFSVNAPTQVKSAFATGDFATGMQTMGVYDGTSFQIAGVDQTTYKDALALALWFVPNSDKLLRVADLIQLEMRYREQHVEHKTVTFLMSNQNTFCRVKSTARLNSILPVISLETDSGMNGLEFQCTKYMGY